MRLVRGSSAFLAAAADSVLELGATAVVSPPLMAGGQTPWRAAGFHPYTSLALLRKHIEGEQPLEAPVRDLGDTEWARVVAIDAAAFGDTWKVELPALVEALRSAPTSALVGIDDPGSGTLAGYAIVACSSGTGYLQRIAIDPAFQQQGLGRSLTRAAHNWSRRRGARFVILNTKPDNAPALSLYHSQGRVALPDRLNLDRGSRRLTTNNSQ
ncbi:MAG: GNAT family N-acetyltransferase [bacterium]|nr:GNAT family N-acetyltransferase [bacterium]